jgi:arylsulfatase
MTAEGLGKGAQAQILDGDKVIASGHIPKLMFMPAGLGEMIDVGRDTGVPVTDYRRRQGRLEGDVSHVALRFK